MGRWIKGLMLVGAGALWFALSSVTITPSAQAQFFWWFDQQPKKAKPKAARPKRQGDDLPPIVPRESLAPPPPDDRPYDPKLMRLAEILGAVHYLRELCGADEGQLWRDQMKEIVKNEGTTSARRAKLVNSFNDGYRGYRRTYRTCTESARVSTTRFSTEGATIAASLAQGTVFASKGPPKTDAASAGSEEAQAAEGAPEAKPAPPPAPAEPEPPD